MQEFKVQSKAINSLGFDSSTLQVTFQSGGVYRYFKVPQAIVEQMLSSDSIGTFFSDNISGQFRSRKVK